MPNLEIMWTKVDEAPALATYSLLPIVEAFVGAAGVSVTLKDISLAGRILASVADLLPPAQRTNDELAELGALTLKPDANIMKLPNISASIPQLRAAIKELQGKGFAVPDYPDTPKTDAEKDIKTRYDRVFGSVVNPVLREGNSDRRAAGAVKQYARDNPHKMGVWGKDSKSHVAHMSSGDYFGSEIATTVDKATNVRIELVEAGGKTTVLKAKTALDTGEIIDAAVMSAKALRKFFAEQIDDAKNQGVLFSLHVKATMMKISRSDHLRPRLCRCTTPMPGREARRRLFAEAGHQPRHLGIGERLRRRSRRCWSFSQKQRDRRTTSARLSTSKRPGLAMVDSDQAASPTCTCPATSSSMRHDARR